MTVTAKLDAEQWTLLGERLTQLEQASKEAAEEAAQYTGKAVGRMRAGVREDLMGVSETLANIATSAAMANIAAERARAAGRAPANAKAAPDDAGEDVGASELASEFVSANDVKDFLPEPDDDDADGVIDELFGIGASDPFEDGTPFEFESVRREEVFIGRDEAAKKSETLKTKFDAVEKMAGGNAAAARLAATTTTGRRGPRSTRARA